MCREEDNASILSVRTLISLHVSWEDNALILSVRTSIFFLQVLWGGQCLDTVCSATPSTRRLVSKQPAHVSPANWLRVLGVRAEHMCVLQTKVRAHTNGRMDGRTND